MQRYRHYLHPSYQLPNHSWLLLTLWSYGREAMCRVRVCGCNGVLLLLPRCVTDDVVDSVGCISCSAAEHTVHQVLVLYAARAVWWMHDSERVVVLGDGMAAHTARVCR